MASQTNYFAENFRAISSLGTDVTQRFVTIDSTGRVSLCGANQYAEGVLENTTAVNDMPGSVSFVGLTKIQVDAAYPIGTYLCAGANGIGTVATNATLQYSRAKMIESSDASGDIVSIRLIDDQVGATGFTGVQGPQGNTGIQGKTGIQGMTGALGNTGAQGATGLLGGQGETGIQGMTGALGNTGAQGTTGIQGSTVDPWIIEASVGTTGVAGGNITNWVYCVFQGVTGIMPFYST